jgi:hypothetical protein
VFEREAGGALVVAGDDERRNLNELTFTPCCRTGSLLRSGDVAVRFHLFAVVGGHHGEQGLLDRAHGTAPQLLANSIMGSSMRGPPDAPLTSH